MRDYWKFGVEFWVILAMHLLPRTCKWISHRVLKNFLRSTEHDFSRAIELRSLGKQSTIDDLMLPLLFLLFLLLYTQQITHKCPTSLDFIFFLFSFFLFILILNFHFLLSSTSRKAILRCLCASRSTFTHTPRVVR